MKVATWNVNSIKVRKDRVLAWLELHQPDVLCLQELKGPTENFPYEAVESLGYRAAVYGQKAYNGVAIVSRNEPEAVVTGFGHDPEDPQARLISAVIEGVTMYSAYFPNGGTLESDKYPYKLDWMKKLATTLAERHNLETEQVAFCGDFNVAPFDDDIARPDEWAGGVLASDEVRDALKTIADLGFEDVFRPFHPEGQVYSWWDYRGRGFERDNGLRIDLVYATARLAARTVGAIVDREERKGESPSDHAPVIVEFAS